MFLVLKLRVLRFKIADDVGRAKAYRPLEHSFFERGRLPDFHAVEVGALFLVLKLRVIGYEIAGDPYPDEVRRPLKHSLSEEGVMSDFHAVEAGLCFKCAFVEKNRP